MTPDQVAVAAKCLNMDLEVATRRAHEVRDGIIRVSSDTRGVGSVLIGPDLSALFFASYISPDQAMEAWESVRRTPVESFEALHRK
ncbi:hypothetical protein [Mycobacteroides franklinii]|uniref:Uncharacterized protein n=1 Tax=Mycobacteroides franklinii TaxID=948102 RepID=A0A4R8R9E8_9MYCO|nr:hypothetical protein [Mycobacteroides franklinii]TDZ43955.1 hypothetical protein CCUG64054_04020 [Mycobacteroides franklinii]TDZ51089.1 hypothetical protein CCUG63697_02605 [Mycobacteroides franklinii]TDZ57509.1 hypothetical protein CCUG63696_04016 [Mycobacteroides franklinii]TDZ64451.1 hypothetical protein CCUG63695_03947 [Mycobacteroides franklinii]TDZ70848.1 hypothetical protein CCUG64056_04020 [Mycobacteroides franklinii]